VKRDFQLGFLEYSTNLSRVSFLRALQGVFGYLDPVFPEAYFQRHYLAMA
jgi:hypothetical protein